MEFLDFFTTGKNMDITFVLEVRLLQQHSYLFCKVFEESYEWFYVRKFLIFISWNVSKIILKRKKNNRQYLSRRTACEISRDFPQGMYILRASFLHLFYGIFLSAILFVDFSPVFLE